MQCEYDTIFSSDEVKRWFMYIYIQLNISQPYVHSMNGQVERDDCTVMNNARTMIASGNVPTEYWETILTACYIINRTPSANMSITLYQAVTGIKPNMNKLVSFYAIGNLLQDQRRKN